MPGYLRVALVLALSSLCWSKARGEDPVPYRFDDPGPVQLTTDALPVELVVLNESAKAIDLSLLVHGPMAPAKTAGLESDREAVGLQFKTDSLTLGPAESARVVVDRAGKTAPEAGRYLASLFSVGGPVVRAEINLSPAPSTETALPEPQFKKWSMHLWRIVPFTQIYFDQSDSYVPLKLPVSVSGDELHQLGYVTSGSDAAAVSWNGDLRPLETGLTGAKLSLDGVESFAGTYDGKIHFRSGDETGDVELDVKIKDFALWPVMALAFGIVIAFGAQQFFQVRRAVWMAQERNDQIGTDFRAAREQFRRIAGVKAFAGFGLATDLERSRTMVRDQLERLENLIMQSVESDPSFVAANEAMAKLEAAVEAWPRFADQLASLEAARAELHLAVQKLGKPPQTQRTAPACLDRATELLQPRELSLESFKECREDVADASAILASWLGLETRIQDQKRRIQEFKGKVTTGGHHTLKTAETILYTVWEEIWRLESSEKLLLCAADLDTSRRKLDGLGGVLQLTKSMKPHEEAGAEAVDSEDRLADGGERRDAYAKRRRYELFVAGLAFAVAILTGLNQLYLDQDFSTPWHYANAIAWGTGTKLALDTVVAGLGRLPAVSKLAGRA